VVLLVLSVIVEFDFVSQIIRVEEDLAALWINVASKRGQNDPTRTNCGKHHGS